MSVRPSVRPWVRPYVRPLALRKKRRNRPKSSGYWSYVVVMSPYALAAATYRHLPSVRIKKNKKRIIRYDTIRKRRRSHRVRRESGKSKRDAKHGMRKRKKRKTTTTTTTTKTTTTTLRARTTKNIYRLKYWVTRSSIHSFACTAYSLACSTLHSTHSFTHSFTHLFLSS